MNCPQSPTDEPKTTRSPPSDLPTPDRILILVIDRDTRVRQAICDTIELEADMHLVGDSGNGPQALTMAHDTHPTVALVDVLQPDAENDLALILQISQLPDCSVVAMSVRGALRTAALAAGAHSFVEKGGDIDELLDIVRSAAPSPAP